MGRHGGTVRDIQDRELHEMAIEGCVVRPHKSQQVSGCQGCFLEVSCRGQEGTLCSKERHWRTVWRDKPVCWIAGQDKRQM